MTNNPIHLGDEIYAEVSMDNSTIEIYNAFDPRPVSITLTRPMLLRLLEDLCLRTASDVLVKAYLTLHQNKPQLKFVSDEAAALTPAEHNIVVRLIDETLK